MGKRDTTPRMRGLLEPLGLAAALARYNPAYAGTTMPLPTNSR